MSQDAPREVDRLRRRVQREAGVVVALTAVLTVVDVRLDLVGAASRAGLDHVLFALAASHLLMLVFGARRAAELRQAFVQRQGAQEGLVHQATHDAVTGLANGSALGAALDAAVPSASDAGPLALLRVRTVGLEEVATTLGHVVRDQCLTELARLLERAAGETGAAGGTGRALTASVQGDEFAVVVPGADEAAAVAVAERLLLVLQDGLEVGVGPLELQAHVGVAVAPVHATSAVGLLGCADVALQAAEDLRTGVQAYRPALDRRDPRRLAVYGELRRGIASGELRVHYQPKVVLDTGRVCGVEALVRWQHPVRGLLAPSEFLDVAEQTGLVRELTHAVLDTALADRCGWAAAGRPLEVAVNLSARGLHEPALSEVVAGLLRAHGATAGDLHLEVTETVAMQDPEQSLAVLRRLRAQGLALAVDDYGTGHASLSYLSRLPLTALKVDRSFVAAMGRSPRDLAIVRSTVDLAHGLGLTVVAEGVETVDAWQALRALGCDQAQGYWLARPVPATDLPATVAALEARLAEPAAHSAADALAAARRGA